MTFQMIFHFKITYSISSNQMSRLQNSALGYLVILLLSLKFEVIYFFSIDKDTLQCMSNS